jgi:hypothetical protein
LELTQPTIDSGIALATRTGGAEQPAVDAFVRHLVATAVH